MVRKTDSDLKNIYAVARAACCPSIALTSVSTALKVWVTNVETALRAGVETAKVIEALEKLNLTAAFLAESSIDLVRILARLMARAVTTKRMLWLRHWTTDAVCGIQTSIYATFHKMTKCCSERPYKRQSNRSEVENQVYYHRLLGRDSNPSSQTSLFPEGAARPDHTGRSGIHKTSMEGGTELLPVDGEV